MENSNQNKIEISDFLKELVDILSERFGEIENKIKTLRVCLDNIYKVNDNIIILENRIENIEKELSILRRHEEKINKIERDITALGSMDKTILKRL